MTELEYVQTIKAAAERHVASILGSGEMIAFYVPALRHWQSIKEGLSPSTVIALCDAWLKEQGKTE